MNKKRICGLVTALTLSPVLSPALAPAMAEEIDEIVVSATGIPTPLAQIGASVDIITAQDLERQQITYLQDALATVAGVSTYQSGGPGSTSNVFLRGMTGKYSGVYVDGVQINDPASQQAAWAYLPTHGLQSVEILRGSQSVLYGSEAIGGAISMFTAVGGETENHVDLQTGSFGTHNIAFSSRGEVDNLGYGFAIKRVDSDGISAANENNGNSEEDGYKSLSARGRFVVDVADDLSFDLAVRSVSSEVKTDASGPTDNNLNYTDFDAVGGRLEARYEVGKTVHSFSVGNSRDDTSPYSVPYGQDSLSALTDEGERDVMAYRGVFTVSDSVQILIGVEDEEEEYRSSEGVYSNENTAIFSLIQYSDAKGLNASYAIRQDDNETFGEFDTHRLAIKKTFSRYGIRGTYGTGFRAPSLRELFGLSDYCVERLCGNESLTPEESRSYDIAFMVNLTEGLNFELAQFEVEVEDVIEYQDVLSDVTDDCRNYTYSPNCGKYGQSTGKTKTSGYELRGSFKMNEATQFALNFTKLEATRPTGQPDIRRPEETLNLSISHTPNERLSLGGSLRAVRKTIDEDFSNWPNTEIVQLDDYALVNLHAGYEVSESLSLKVRVENALDDDYETALGFGTPGRAAYIGVTSSF